ncbi:hypothetical protein [Marinifilum fragile]|uniref:hypothetical protein n=1 Tax=Marinifilum fragile TaxID=570161 RepID=UPI002AA8AC11|nr:hypothetical protein [Marinifilum fragile]
MMKYLLLVLTIITLVGNIVLRNAMYNAEGGTGLAYVIMIPIYWVLSLIIIISLSIFYKRKETDYKYKNVFFWLIFLLNLAFTSIFVIDIFYEVF